MLLGITTSPRPKSYLLNSIKSIRANSGNVKIQLIIAPCFIDYYENWNEVRALLGPDDLILEPYYNKTLLETCDDNESNIYLSANKHRGIEYNTNRLMEYMATRSNSFVICQDDIEFCKNAIPRIAYIDEETEDSKGRGLGCGCVSFYTPYRACGQSRTALWAYPPGRFYGELCLLWKSRSALDYLKHSNVWVAHDIDIMNYFRHSGDIHDRMNLYAHSPCLIQHMGIESARGDNAVRRTPNYKNEYDALGSRKPLC